MFKKIKKIAIIFIVMVAIGVYNIPSKEEKEAELIELKAKAKKMNKLEVDENIIVYKKLLEHEPKNNIYKTELNKYIRMDKIAQECRVESRKKDKSSLVNPSTYSDTSDRLEVWENNKIFYTQSTFLGKNKLGLEFKYMAKYKCTIKNDGLSIKKLFLKQI